MTRKPANQNASDDAARRIPLDATPTDASANPTLEVIQSIGWDELGEVFGSRSIERGERYFEQGRVSGLAWTTTHQLVATVTGGQPYQTLVSVGADRELLSECSCPVGLHCKHAVAMVFAILDASVAGDVVPTVDSIRDADPSRGRSSRRAKSWEPTREVIRDWLATQRSEELIDRLLRGFDRDQAARDELCTAYRLASGSDVETIADVERRIDSLTAEEVWRGDWYEDGGLPDYAGLERQFTALRDAGMDAALIDLGVRLLERGTQQLERADDDGETGMAISHCLEVAFASLREPVPSTAERLLLVFDLIDRDEFGVLPLSVHTYLERRHTADVWAQVAERLRERLATSPDAPDFQSRYRRRRLVDRAVFAMDQCGRSESATQLIRDEAVVTRSWVRLVDRRIDAGDLDTATAEALEGLSQLADDDIGERAELRDRLRQVAERRGDVLAVAAFRADDFFRRPSVETFVAVRDAAAAASVERPVREWLEHYLRSGRSPAGDRGTTGGVAGRRDRRQSDPNEWPLPTTGDSVATSWSAIEGLRVLRDVAIVERKPDAVLEYHERLRRTQSPQSRSPSDFDGEVRVAHAVAETHPDRAVAIYLDHVDRLLETANAKVYSQAISLLGRVRTCLGRTRATEWKTLLSGLRDRHARKRNFLDALDRLTRSPMDTAKARRARRQ